MTTSLHPNNKLNELTASEWISRTVSIFTQRGLGRSSKEAKYEKLHPAPFSFTDVTRFIEFFTKSNGQVLDPFGGVGSTAKAAALLRRYCTCVEISPYFAELSEERLNDELPEHLREYAQIVCGDIRQAIRDLEDAHYNLILTSPPYWSILNKVDHKAKQERLANGVLHNYGSRTGDLSNIKDYGMFVDILAKIFDDLSAKVHSKGHAVIFVGDFRHKSRYFMFHSELAMAIEDLGNWHLKGINIMYQKHKKVFPYGYPYSYVPNLHHQYVLIFQRVK